jgi:hypothetical protein
MISALFEYTLRKLNHENCFCIERCSLLEGKFYGEKKKNFL